MGGVPLTAVKIVKATLAMAVDEEFVDISVEEIAEGNGYHGGLADDRAARELAALRAALP